MITEPVYIFASVALIGATIGAYVDAKETWIPDAVNYFMIAFGLLGHLLLTIIESSYAPIIFSLVGFLVFLGIGLTFYKFGITGGGDAKIFMGFGALLATFPSNSVLPFLGTLFSNIIIAGFFVSIIWIIYIVAKNFSKFRSEFKQIVKKWKLILYLVSLTLILPIIGILMDNLLLSYIGIVAFPTALLLLIAKSTEACMYKSVKPKNLMEGDWLLEEISVEDFKHVPKRTGIDKETIEKLKHLENIGKLDHVTVKQGLAMGPAIFVGLIISIFVGDLMSMAFSFLF